MNKFQTDLQTKGQPLEEALLLTFHTKGLFAHLNDSPTLEGKQSHDIKLSTPYGDILLEAKMDWGSLPFGNVCFEIEAIQHSKADYFVYGIPQVNVYTRAEVEDLITRFPQKIGGDQKDNRIVNVPKRYLKLNNVGQTLWDFVRPLTEQQ